MRAFYFGPSAWEPLASAWKAYHAGDRDAALEVHADDGDHETMPVAVFFRSSGALRGVDRVALDLARGRVLDGGAGVGSLALLLEERGLSVTALEVIPEGVAIMRDRGVKDPREGRLQDLPKTRSYDTVLLLMNGSALAGTLEGLPDLLSELEGLLAPGGQLLMDSTDLLQGQAWEEGDGEEEYPGQFLYQMEFQGTRGAPFPQLFLDPGTLARVARESGWLVEVVVEEEGGEYLARLTRKPSA